MEIGVANYPAFSLSPQEFFKLARKLEVKYIEVKLDDKKFCDFLAKGGKFPKAFRYTCHLPFIDVNLGNPNLELRGCFEAFLRKSIFMAKEFGAEIVVCHAGRLSRDYPANLLAKARGEAASSLKKLFETSRKLGVEFTIENDHNSPNLSLAGRPREVLEMANKVGCGVTLDLGHANTFEDPENFIKALGKKIINIHVHDNNGKKDQHLAVGKGKIKFEKIFRVLNEIGWNGPLIIEAHKIEDLIEDVKRLKEIVSRLE